MDLAAKRMLDAGLRCFGQSINLISLNPEKFVSCSAKGERTLNGRYVHTMINYKMKMQGMPDMNVEGMHMLTYDPAAKQYVAWWFDGTASTVMRMAGLIDNVLDFARGRLGGGIALDRNTRAPLDRLWAPEHCWG